MVDRVSSCMDHNPRLYCILLFCKGVLHPQQVHKLGYIENVYFFISYKMYALKLFRNTDTLEKDDDQVSFINMRIKALTFSICIS